MMKNNGVVKIVGIINLKNPLVPNEYVRFFATLV
jgi:hypothetical protein